MNHFATPLAAPNHEGGLYEIKKAPPERGALLPTRKAEIALYELLRRVYAMPEEESMFDRLEYKGFVICPAPHQRADDGPWEVHITIERLRGDREVARPFSAATQRLGTRDEAVRHCLHFGKRIIDGKAPGLTVNDMT